MFTYQDFVKKKGNEAETARAVKFAINQHKNTNFYKVAVDADEYMRGCNVTIKQYQKFLYTVSGQTIPDSFSPNYKMANRFFYRFITQQVQYSLGNGVQWEDDSILSKIENKDYIFDSQLKKAARNAKTGGVSFGFFNLDHIEVFKVTEFAPLFDEIDGTLKAGVKFWQIDEAKPLRATLYELDGYTEYIWYSDLVLDESWTKLEDGVAFKPKKAYITKIQSTQSTGVVSQIGENYPTFPIVPFWANEERQSELVGLREKIDCYDLINNGYADSQEQADFIYWTISNAGGMDDIDLARFIERLKTIHATTVDDEAQIQSHSIEAPFQGREALLDRIEKNLYRDAMTLDVDRIAGGAVTATQIEAAYEPLNQNADMFEYQVLDFIKGILNIAGVEGKASFTRSMIVNQDEMISVITQSASFLSSDYVTQKILTILGDGDKADEMIAQMKADEMPTIDDEE